MEECRPLGVMEHDVGVDDDCGRIPGEVCVRVRTVGEDAVVDE